MENLFKNKWVLYGGGALAALAVFMYMRGGSTDESSDSGGYPSILYAGMGAGGYATGTAPTTTQTTSDSTSYDATSQLLSLQGKKIDYDYALGLKSAENERYGLEAQKEVQLKSLDTDVNMAALDFYKSTLANKKSPITRAVGAGGSLTLDRTTSGGFKLDLSRV